MVIVKNEWLTSEEEARLLLLEKKTTTNKTKQAKATTRCNSRQGVHKRLGFAAKQLLQRSGVRKVPLFRFAFSDRKDMGPSRAAWVRITASHVSTMGTYPV